MSTKIPSWLSNYMTNADLEKIRELIQQIELKTRAELVPLVVHSSIDLILFRFLLVSLALLLSILIAPLVDSLLGWNSFVSMEFISAGLALVLSIFAFWASSNSLVLRLFLSKAQLQLWVHRRACSEFFDNRLHHAESRAAVLFMYSVLERKAMIIADPSLSQFPQEIWQKAITMMIAAAKKKNFQAGFKEALEFTAEQLATHYPPNLVNKNEIADHVVIKN